MDTDSLPEIIVGFTTNYDKILNPHQRQILEDTKRVRDQLDQLERQRGFGTPDLYVRKTEEKSDPDEMDARDSFYITTKSLLVLFQLMGVMPIMRSPKGSDSVRTTFSWTSRAFIWAYLIYGIETVVVCLVARERFIKFLAGSDKRFDEVIYNIIFLSILAPHFLLPVASWRNGLEVAKFKNMWTEFQVRYLRVTKEVIEFPILKPITWTLCFFSWGCSILIVLSQFYLQPDFPFSHTFAYYHILAMLNGFCSLWFINCTAFGLASRALQKHVSQTIKSEKPAKKLAEYRNLWVDLSHMMQQLGKAYSNMYGIYCLVIFFTTIIASYGSLSEIIDHGVTFKELGLFIIVIYCMTLLFIICNEAHHASRRVGLGFQEILLNVNLTTVDLSTQREIEMFLVAIDKNPPTMNLGESEFLRNFKYFSRKIPDGYANINRELITSNVSFMATYLVVLMQFKLTLLRTTQRKEVAAQMKEGIF